MSQENVEVVRVILAEWEKGNFGARATLFDPGITFETRMGAGRVVRIVHLHPLDISPHHCHGSGF